MSYYYFELVMAGAILLTAMLGTGITLMIRRRKQKTELENTFDEKKQTDIKSTENRK